MANPYSQDTRIGRFDTPLGKDKLVLRQFHGTEGMSELFEFRIEAVATERSLNFDSAIGKNCTLTIKTISGGERVFDGILTELRLQAEEEEGLVYELVLRPWLWLLSKTRNCRIFHEQTAPQIISEVFGKHGSLARFEDLLSKNYPKLEYVVQYRESDMDFARRLMEEHGIGFYFRHEVGNHTLVMGDGTRAYKPIPGEKRSFIGTEAYHQREEEHLFQWTLERKFTTGAVVLNDYDFKRPTANMRTGYSGDAAYAHGTLEEYDYPGRYVDEGVGGDYAQVRLNRARGADGHFLGKGDCLSCFPGCLLSLIGHPDDAQNRKYLALRCTHTFLSEAYRSARRIVEQGYKGVYEFMDAVRPYVPDLLTLKPYLRGPQTAVVVGQGEIDCDEFGRVLVHFHWERDGEHSMRARVAQVWASNKWGAIFIPRVGDEVLVDFLEGDPDRPMVVGAVYNGHNKPPYDLPGEKNVAGWKSNSTPGGGGYNEIAMDDTKGKELLRVHAQHDLDTTVRHDEQRHVMNDRKTTIDVNDTLNVGNELFVEAKSKITLKVGTSTIVMTPDGVTIEAVNIKADAKANLETNSKALASHNADAAMRITSAMIKIN